MCDVHCIRWASFCFIHLIILSYFGFSFSLNSFRLKNAVK